MVVLAVFLVVIAADAAFIAMIASGIEEALRSKYEDKKRALDEKEAMLMDAARQYAKEMYIEALRRTHIVYRTKIEVVDDPLGKDEAV